MSGHSHSKKIKHQKGITDQKRGQVFSKFSRVISVAAREGGGDPDTNPKLRTAVEQAKKLQMPSENIERAIKRGTGESKEAALEPILVEALGPGGIAILIEGITDNKNRALSEIKQILARHGAKEGAVRWQFNQKGTIRIDSTKTSTPKEELELAVIDAGGEDILWENDILVVYTKPDSSEALKRALGDKNLLIESSSLEWIAENEVAVDEQTRSALEKLFEALDEHEAVQEIYSNLKV